MTRSEWLASLAVGNQVRLITPLHTHHATVDRRCDNRLWLIWVLGAACDLGYSATWVDAITGDNDSHAYRIEPMNGK